MRRGSVPRGWLLVLLYVCGGHGNRRMPGAEKHPHILQQDDLDSILSNYDIISISDVQQHSLTKRDLQTELHIERMLSFSALNRHFKLYLTSSTEHVSENFKATIVDGNGKESEYPVKWPDFFTGHVVGEHSSKVFAHIGDGDFTVRIQTDGEEYNVEPLWRFIDNPKDERMLVYRSEDIKDISKLASPQVCGYIKAEDERFQNSNGEDSTSGEEHLQDKRRREMDSQRKHSCPLVQMPRNFRTSSSCKELPMFLNRPQDLDACPQILSLITCTDSEGVLEVDDHATARHQPALHSLPSQLSWACSPLKMAHELLSRLPFLESVDLTIRTELHPPEGTCTRINNTRVSWPASGAKELLP